MLGTSFFIVGVPFVLRYFRLPDRIVFTVAGLGLLAWWLPPESVIHTLLPFLPENMNGGMELFILSGIAVVAGSIWAVMYNSDILLAAVVGIFGRLKGLPPILKISVNYPMRTRFRTGMALAMFSLIIFTMTFMAAMMNSFTALYDDIPRVSGGFDVQGITGYANPVNDVSGTLASRGDGIGPDDFTAIGSLSTAGTELRQKGAENQDWSQFAIQGADAGYLDNINYTFKMKDKTYQNRRRCLAGDKGPAGPGGGPHQPAADPQQLPAGGAAGQFPDERRLSGGRSAARQPVHRSEGSGHRQDIAAEGHRRHRAARLLRQHGHLHVAGNDRADVHRGRCRRLRSGSRRGRVSTPVTPPGPCSAHSTKAA